MVAAMKRDLVDFNEKRLIQLNEPICVARAENRPAAARNCKDDDAQSLRNTLFLAHGAKVMLTRNMFVEAKLSNGSIGYIRYIVYKPGEEQAGGPPFMVVVEFEDYTGPEALAGHPKCVPIFRERAMWKQKVGRQLQDYHRTQFPLIPADGLSIHKAQGKNGNYTHLCQAAN